MWPLILLCFLEPLWLLFSITVLLISFWPFQLLFLSRSLKAPRWLFPVVSFCFLPYSEHISLSSVVLGNALYTSHSFQERPFSLRFLSDLPAILPSFFTWSSSLLALKLWVASRLDLFFICTWSVGDLILFLDFKFCFYYVENQITCAVV